jgi:hypothetical protein
MKQAGSGTLAQDADDVLQGGQQIKRGKGSGILSMSTLKR